MATPAYSHKIILPESRQIVLVKARPGERVRDGGPDYTILLMELKTDQGSVPVLVPLVGSHVLDHETCVKLARWITLSVTANIVEHSGEINGNNVEEGEEEEVCVICLDELKKGDVLELTECEHRYHEQCIENWLQLKQNCPICRVEI